jgi:hypothetical protein
MEKKYGNADVYGNAWVSGIAEVYGDAWVSGIAKVYGDAEVLDDDVVGNDMKVMENPYCTPSNDMVNHPSHYMSETGLEAIDVIEAFTFDLKGIEAVCTGNALKYLCRWKSKNGVEDLKKAEWYLNRLIKHVEKLEKENECHE